MNTHDFPGWKDLRARIEETGLTLDQGCWLAGGALLRAAIGEPQDADLDFYCCNGLAWVAADIRLGTVAREMTQGVFSRTYQMPSLQKVQLINREEAGPQECIERFDFSVCQLAWDGTTLYVGEHTEADIAARLLRCVNRSTRTPKRLEAYAARGFRITAETVVSALGCPQEGYEYDT